VEFSSQRLVDVFVAAPVGQIDHPNADTLRLALAPTLDAAILARLDRSRFSRVTYISSMGLRVLLLAAKELRAVNGKMAIAALQPVVTEIFAIARFNHVLEIFPDVRTALEQYSAPALAAYDAAAR
jgi:anti-anti-sigma factor